MENNHLYRKKKLIKLVAYGLNQIAVNFTVCLIHVSK